MLFHTGLRLEVNLRQTSKLAVNYSKPAAALLNTGEISVDLFKCPDWPDLIAEAQAVHPAYVHFPFFTGRMTDDRDVWAQVARLRDLTGTRFLNIHLAPHIDNFSGMTMESTAARDIQRVVDLSVRDIRILAARFGIENVIVENAPYDARPKYAIPRAALLPETMARVIEATGAGLLLDTAHVRISARMLGISTMAYMTALPTANLRELHVTGVAWDVEQARWNDHYAMAADDWPPVEAAFDHIHAGDWPVPQIVALEYGGVGGVFETRSDRAVLKRDLGRLAGLMQPGVQPSGAE